jgi:rhodanese-related sulfurtransferase
MRIARIATQPVVVMSAGTRSATASGYLLDAKYFALHA